MKFYRYSLRAVVERQSGSFDRFVQVDDWVPPVVRTATKGDDPLRARDQRTRSRFADRPVAGRGRRPASRTVTSEPGAGTLRALDRGGLQVLATSRRIRGGDFTATPDQWRCGRCDYKLICPSRWGAAAAV